MLEQGYIEILTPTLQPDPGLRLACFGTPDAEGERRRLADHGFEPQPVVDLQRELDSNTVRFKVVRPASGKMPEGRIQYVQHLTPQHVRENAGGPHPVRAAPYSSAHLAQGISGSCQRRGRPARAVRRRR